MRATEWSDRVLDNWVGLLVDTVSVLISLSAATAIRFGTLGVTQYLVPLWPAVVLLVGVRLGFLQALGLHNAPATVFRRRQVVSLVAVVALSSVVTAFLVLGFTLPLGRAGWFPFSLLLLELPLGVICGAAVRLGWRIWEQSIVPKWARELEVLRSRAGTILSALFVALAVVVLWQALGLVAALLPVTLESVLAAIRVLVLSAVLFLLPGYALLALARPRIGLGPLDGLIVSAGLSVAVVPLLLYFCSLAGIELNSFSVGAIFILLGALALWRSLPQMRRMVGNPRLRSARRGWRVRLGQVRSLWKGGITEGQAFYTALALVFLMAFLVRFYVVRDLSVGMWADSYTHTVICELLVRNGGLFNSWEPYAPLTSFTYHFGFHALVAFYHWLTGASVTGAVVLVGQILNALAVPLMYLLTARFTKSRWAGLIAALIVGFLCAMPMYYVNWGRYTQLMGETILPIAMVFSLGSVVREDSRPGVIIAGALVFAALIVSHYLVAAMYVCFLLVLVLYATWRAMEHGDRGRAMQAWVTAVVIMVGGLVFVSPWLANLLQGLLPRWAVSTAGMRSSVGALDVIVSATANGDILLYLDGYLWALSGAGILFAVAERRAEPTLMFVWVGLLFLVVVSGVLPLPSRPEDNVFALLIGLYVPASVLCGFFVSRLIDMAGGRHPWIGLVALCLSLLVVLAGQRQALGRLVPENSLLTDADEEAMDWIRKTTAQDAKFMIDSWFWNEWVLGGDGGWWIPVLTGRRTTVPPALYVWETSQDPEYALEVQEFANMVQRSHASDPEMVQLLRENAVTHVYVGERARTLTATAFFDSPCYRLVYQTDGVSVFEVVYACLDSAVGGRGGGCTA